MAKTFHFTIAHVGDSVFDGDVVSARIPGNEGLFEVLADHEAFITHTKEGMIRITLPNGSLQEIPIAQDGVVEVSHNQATLLL